MIIKRFVRSRVTLLTMLIAGGALWSSAASAVTLTSDVTSVALSEGDRSSVTFTFTNDLSTKAYIAHIKVVSTKDWARCHDECIQSVSYSDGMERTFLPGGSYTFTIPITSLADGETLPDHTGPQLSNLVAKVTWELNQRGLGKATLVDTVPVTVQDAGPSSPAASRLAPASPTPEPASWALMIAGFGGVGAAVRRRRQSALTA